jgi:trans-aconitate methyltransferase
VTLRLPVAYFEEIYGRAEDPWDFETSWYERRKYELTLAALPRERYRRAFEPGCANGALTERLASRCDELVALEPVAEVARRAARRMGHADHVSVTVGALPEDWPPGPFDLVVFSEVAYYLTERGLTLACRRAVSSLRGGGHLIAVHWTGATDYPVTGVAVHERLRAERGLRCLVDHRDERFLLTVLEAR